MENKTEGESKVNIYLQDKEPDKKQGIWLKVDGKRYNRVIAKDTVTPTSEFEDKTIVLLNGSTYKTQLYSNELVDSSVKYPFSDVWLYEVVTGLITDIPSYYGDGTQWINFKNLPSNETNDEGNIEI